MEKCCGNVGTSSVNFGVKHSDESDGKPRCFWIGYSYASDRYFDGQISEVRIWNKALTPEEVNAPDRFYQVAAASDGLEASWKIDAGAGKAGNSEAGHSNLGAGRCVMQDDVRLDAAVQDGSFARNPVFLEAIEHARRNHASLHLLAYLTHKSSHGCIDYPLAICEMAKKQGLEEVYFHIIFDGRSTEPGSAPALLAELDSRLDQIGLGRIVDGVGRGVVLDRDKNFD